MHSLKFALDKLTILKMNIHNSAVFCADRKKRYYEIYSSCSKDYENCTVFINVSKMFKKLWCSFERENIVAFDPLNCSVPRTDDRLKLVLIVTQRYRHRFPRFSVFLDLSSESKVTTCDFDEERNPELCSI